VSEVTTRFVFVYGLFNENISSSKIICVMQETAGLVSSFELRICRKGIRIAARSTETFGRTMALKRNKRINFVQFKKSLPVRNWGLHMWRTQQYGCLCADTCWLPTFLITTLPPLQLIPLPFPWYARPCFKPHINPIHKSRYIYRHRRPIARGRSRFGGPNCKRFAPARLLTDRDKRCFTKRNRRWKREMQIKFKKEVNKRTEIDELHCLEG